MLNQETLKKAEDKINSLNIKEVKEASDESYLDLTTEELVKRALERFGSRRHPVDALIRGIKKKAKDNEILLLVSATKFVDLEKAASTRLGKELLRRIGQPLAYIAESLEESSSEEPDLTLAKRGAAEVRPIPTILKLLLSGGLGFGAGYGVASYRNRPMNIISNLLQHASSPEHGLAVLQSALNADYDSKELTKRFIEALDQLNATKKEASASSVKKPLSLAKQGAVEARSIPTILKLLLSGGLGFGAGYGVASYRNRPMNIISNLLQHAGSPEHGLAILQSALNSDYDSKELTKRFVEALEQLNATKKEASAPFVKKSFNFKDMLFRLHHYQQKLTHPFGFSLGGPIGNFIDQFQNRAAVNYYTRRGLPVPEYIRQDLNSIKTPKFFNRWLPKLPPSFKRTPAPTPTPIPIGAGALAKPAIDVSSSRVNLKKSGMDKSAILPIIAALGIGALGAWGAPKVWNWFKNWVGAGVNEKLFRQNLSLVHDPYRAIQMLKNFQQSGGKLTPQYLDMLQRMVAARSNPWFSGRY